MKRTAIIIISIVCLNCFANTYTNVVGSWIQYLPRTPSGTGSTNRELIISGLPGDYRVCYKFGSISHVWDSKGRVCRKSITTSFWDLRLEQDNDIFMFTVPDQNTVIRLRLSKEDGRDCLKPIPQEYKRNDEPLAEGAVRVHTVLPLSISDKATYLRKEDK